jgi:hypothetical protein
MIRFIPMRSTISRRMLSSNKKLAMKRKVHYV